MEKQCSTEAEAVRFLYEQGLTVANHTHRQTGPGRHEYDLQDKDGYYKGTITYDKIIKIVIGCLFPFISQAQTYDEYQPCASDEGDMGLVLGGILLVFFFLWLIYRVLFKDELW